MVVRLLILAVFAAIVSAFAMAENLQTPGAVLAVLAMAVLALAIFTPSTTLARFSTLLRPLLVIALAAPALWMALQVVPMPVRAMGNPIWEAASAALNQPLAGRLTVDVNATVLALAQYGAVLAIALVTAVITLDRQRAAYVLYLLVAIATLVSVWSIWRTLGSQEPSLPGEPAVPVANGSVAAALGALLSAAMAIRAIEQLGHYRQPPRFAAGPVMALAAAILSFLICLTAILISANSTTVIATLLGTGALLAVVAVRRWFFGPWGSAAVLATAAIVLVASFTMVPFNKNTDLTIALSRQDQIATERMLQDIGPAGSGAGAFNVLLPIYRDVDPAAQRERPTAAAAIAVEMGRVFLYGLLVVAVLGAVTLFRRAMARGHDYVYAAAGGGASIVLPILAFADDGILDLGTSLLIAALYGLAFGQSLSGSALEVMPSISPRLSEKMNRSSPARWPALLTSYGSPRIRIALTCIGIVLIAQAAHVLWQSWSVGDGLSRAAAPDRLLKAASLAPVREDARTDKGLVAATRPGTGEAAGQMPPPFNAFAEALRYSPVRGDLWLMLAAMSKQHASSRYDTAALLRMSYYTAPNDVDLFPLRLSVGLGTDAAIRDPELRDLIRRDLKLVVARQPASPDHALARVPAPP